MYRNAFEEARPGRRCPRELNPSGWQMGPGAPGCSLYIYIYRERDLINTVVCFRGYNYIQKRPYSKHISKCCSDPHSHKGLSRKLFPGKTVPSRLSENHFPPTPTSLASADAGLLCRTIMFLHSSPASADTRGGEKTFRKEFPGKTFIRVRVRATLG